MSFTAIVNALRLQRKARDAELEYCARERYGPSFAEEFTYRQGADTGIVMSKQYAIAKAFLARNSAD